MYDATSQKNTNHGGGGVFNKLGLGSAALLAMAPAFAQQQDFSAAHIETHQLTPNLFMLELVGEGAGNIALSTGADGSVLVDTQFAPLNGKILAAVRAARGSDVKYVINTHWHGDHTGGNEPFGRAGAVIIAHDNVLARMSTEQFMSAFNQRTPPSPAAALPVVTFPSRTTFRLNGDVLQVVHVENAHTDGDSIVHFTNANVIHTGDTYMKDVYPFIDVSSNGSIDGFIASADAVLSRSDANTKIIPGHGALANKADLQRFHDMLVAVRGKIQALIDLGMSEDEVFAAGPTAEFDAAWGQGFMTPENFTRFAYQSLKK
jgi:glyoxylase-like metal-dependent hydrolase (beta-lactamase superfamily II)